MFVYRKQGEQPVAVDTFCLANGWIARFGGETRRPLIFWALIGKEIVGLVHKDHNLYVADGLTDDRGQQFQGYVGPEE